ncbi:BnaCnng61350D [Brassica napus]|uniref:BnaCnng61350D protein n=1 Tax=Brassica napus TaxID=3708 RepID=A0A078JQC2_BRANA|nr:BnaCnng61350D [Brassica napus]
MDGEEMLDWELVHGSDTDSITSEKESSVIDDGMIVSDHLSADHPTTEQSIGSGDSSRVDCGSEYPNPVVLGFDQLDVYQSGVRNELRFIDGEVKVSDFQPSDENNIMGEDNLQVESQAGVEEHIEDASMCLSETDNLQVESRQAGVEEHIEDVGKSLSESEGNELVSGDSGNGSGEEEIVSDSEAVEGSGGDTSAHVVAVDSAFVRSGDEGKKSSETVWWKMPFVLVKYYALRIGPVWSVSMAAAVMGFVLLGRRLYHMKKKAQRIHLKVAIDEKKVSRVMSQAARLNAAFSEVKRVPVIRPALPSPGAWPVLSLR